MHFFIDEAGPFVAKREGGASISCIGGLTVPSARLSALETNLKFISTSWPRAKNGEIKGSKLNEPEIATLCDMLCSLGVLFEAAVVDLEICTEAEIAMHRQGQAEGITRNLTSDHSPTLTSQVWELRRRLEKLRPQLYVQSVCLTHLIWTILEHGQLYHCQRNPGELAKFVWRIDAKDPSRITEYEALWSDTLLPILQSRSMRTPLTVLVGGDYSAYRRNFPRTPIPEYLKAHRRAPRIASRSGFDPKPLFKDLRFEPSHTSTGLQVVDVLTNALRRALSGRLQEPGWRPLSKLMILQRAGSVQMITLGRDGPATRPYSDVVMALNASGRSLLVAGKERT